MDESALRAEGDALHRALFGRPAPADVAARYAAAHAHVLLGLSDAERAWMARALGSDLEALEIALRKRHPDHVLCRKFKLLAALAEAGPEAYDDFVNERPRRVAAFAVLAWHAARTLLKALKGRVLLGKLGA